MHGGKRKGAGRPAGRGPWKEKTIAMRIPLSMKAGVDRYLDKRGYSLPLYSSRIPAGTPNMPVNDVEAMIDLNSWLLRNPDSSFLLRVVGDSMIDVGIHDGDMLVVDRSIEPITGKIVAAMVDGEATVKRFRKDSSGKLTLLPENKNYTPTVISKNHSFEIAGVVVDVIRRL